LEKIGVNKCIDDKIKYYNKFHKSQNIYINNPNLEQISSTIVECNIVSYNLLENINMFKVLMKFSVKIIYSTTADPSLYIYDKEFLTVQYISLPSFIDGVSTNNLYLQKKIKIESFIENISSKLINNNRVLVDFYIILNLKINSDFYIAYVINDKFGDNIFLSFSNGQNLTQKTFSVNSKFKNLIFSKSSSNLFYIDNAGELSKLCYLNFSSKKRNLVKSDFNLNDQNICLNKNVDNFVFKDKNTILLTCKDDYKSLLYSYNIKKDELKGLSVLGVNSNYLFPYYDDNKKVIYFLSDIDNIRCLCLIDQRNNFDIIYNFSNVVYYTVSIYSNNILIKDDMKNIYILNSKTKEFNPININFEYTDILKALFYKSDTFGESLLILYSMNDFNCLLIYNLKSLSYKILYDTHSINDFDIDHHSLDIFICCKSKNFCEVIKINKNIDKYENVLKLPSNVKKIFLRK
jgi:hypothetical protein